MLSRRGFLKFLGVAPLLPVAAKLAPLFPAEVKTISFADVQPWVAKTEIEIAADIASTFNANMSGFAFLTAELDMLDAKCHHPLQPQAYMRDIEFNKDISIADDITEWADCSKA